MTVMDREKIERFLDRFVGFAAGTTTIALLAVSDRSGLIRWLGEHGGGSPSEIAAGAGLDERYVTEILSGLAASGVVEHRHGVFTLPPEHALLLADESSPYFMGGWLDMLPAAMESIDRLTEVATHGGGIPFEESKGLVRSLDRGLNAPSQSVLLTRKWLPSVTGLVDRLEAGIRVADVGCGTGAAAITLAMAYPRSEVVGYDVFGPALEVARSRAEEIDNLDFEPRSVDEIPIEPGFDLITAFDVIHDLADPLAGLTRIRQALRQGGQFLMMEPNVGSDVDDNLGDIGALFYGISTFHCMTQSLARGGAGLGAAWGRERAEAMAADAGFTDFRRLDDITNRFSAFYLLQP
jgi:SAM-dependent methyltransferase